MKGIWQFFTFGRFRSPRLMTSQNGCRLQEKTLCGQRLSPRRSCSRHAALPSTSLQVFVLQPSRRCFRHCEVSSGTVFSCVSSCLRSLFRRIARVSATSRTALHANLRLLTRDESLPHAFVHVFCLPPWESVTLEHRSFSLYMLQQCHLAIDSSAHA